MSVLTAQGLSKFFGADELFADISLSIPPGAKIALVGSNGAGKTTLIQILIGLEPASSGKIHLARDTRLGYLPQVAHLEGGHTVHEEMLKAFEALRKQEAALHELAAQLAGGDQSLLDKYGQQQEAFELAGGYTYEIEIEQVLTGLGFGRAFYEQPLSKLSGGQKTRVLLARLLLEKPDLLVLDEPTNHLDIKAIEWLENYLRNFEGAVLLVSHDRYFMDHVAGVVWELEWGELDVYRGNFSHYVQQRSERHERLLKELQAQQEFIAKERDYIQRNIAGQNTTQAKGRLKRLERLMSGTDRHNRPLQNTWLKKAPPKKRNLHMQLQAKSRTGDQVLKTRGLAVGYHQTLFQVPDLLLLRGEVAAILGPNGAGKSTFLKTILGQLAPIQGEAIWGAQVQIGYFAQAHEGLDPNKTLLDEILETKEMLISEARNYLATYLFSGDDVFRPVGSLSGGERGRLALAKLALAGANVLLLDEPSNHLDIASQEILQDVLAEFGGTILLVSHDRYLVEALASQIWYIEQGRMSLFKGGYRAYMEDKRKAEAPPNVTPSKATQSNGAAKTQAPNQRKGGLSPYQLEKKLKSLEAQVHQLEAELAQINEALSEAAANGQFNTVSDLGYKHIATEAALNAALEEWASLAD